MSPVIVAIVLTLAAFVGSTSFWWLSWFIEWAAKWGQK